jgi:mRNA interferase HigB
MRVVKPSTVRAYAKQYSDAASSLEGWLRITRVADWHSLHDVRNDIPSADGVVVESCNTVVVFNIGGNKYRLIAAIKYQYAMVYVLRFLTHKEYDKDKWKKEL